MSFEKIVKLACKPKAAAPKAKYLDSIIAATYSEDGAVPDVCRALAPRLREPNAIVVFKALIVLHTMLRTGNTENVLSYLATTDPLRLHNVAHGHWEGYSAPEHLAAYAAYLQMRVKAYRDLKHDAIRVQTESNRDHRVSAMEGERQHGNNTGVSRSKTVVGRKLRVMSVEKGLLRETKIVQGLMDAVVDTKFYLDNLEDELNTTALRMLVKDLLVLFQAVNEGIINLLENYFEMSHVDAEQALALYRKFCKQTEKVVEYLSVAKKLQNLLNVSIPNLRHAPVSLVNSLEEYLRDPNFEQNRLEYKSNKAAADGKPLPKSSSKPAVPSLPVSTSVPSTSTATPADLPGRPQSVADFFMSIEQDQPTMFNPNTNSPTSNYFQQQATVNPFVQRQLAVQPTGSMPSVLSPQGPFNQQQQAFLSPFTSMPNSTIQPQFTGALGANGPFIQPQSLVSAILQPQTASGPFLQAQPTSGAFLQPQPTPVYLQPQSTGSNPFRQSIMIPQTTGMPSFNFVSSSALGGGSNSNPFPRPGSAAAFVTGPSRSTTLPPLQEMVTGVNYGSMSAAKAFSPEGSHSAFAMNDINNGMGAFIARPASTPIRSAAPSSSLQPVTSHQTGSRNPFGQPLPPPVPPMPKAPTLMQLATGAAWSSSSFTATPAENNQEGTQSTSLGGIQSHTTDGGGLIGSIASSFASSPFAPVVPGSAPSPSRATGAPSVLSSQPTASSTWSSSMISSSTVPSFSTAPTSQRPSSPPLQPQVTGFGGSSIRPFKPSSSFGASLAQRLPPFASEPSTPSETGLGAGGSTPAPNLNGMGGTTSPANGSGPSQTSPAFGALNAGQQSTFMGGSSFTNNFSGTSRLQPQSTGGPNPFRASMLSTGGDIIPYSLQPNFKVGSESGNAFGGQQQQQGAGMLPQFTGFGSHFGNGAFGGSTSGSFNSLSPQEQQRNQGQHSLI